MRSLLFVLFIAALMYSPTLAQNETTPEVSAEACDAQTWYDEVDAVGGVPAAYAVVVDGNTRMSARRAGVVTIQGLALIIETADYPECVAVPRDWYLDGLDKLATALTALLDGKVSDFTITSIEAAQFIGQWRGYLAAVGVELAPLTGIFAFK